MKTPTHPHPPCYHFMIRCCCLPGVSGISTQWPMKELFHARPRCPWLPSGPSKTNRPQVSFRAPGQEAHVALSPTAQSATCRNVSAALPQGIQYPPDSPWATTWL